MGESGLPIVACDLARGADRPSLRISQAWTIQLSRKEEAMTAECPRTESATSLSLVFPAFNEAENLPALIESAISIGEGLDLDFEIVIVDDGSQDRSAGLLADSSARDPRIRAVHHAA